MFFLYGVLKAQTGLVLIYLVRVRAGGKECKCDRFGLCQIGYQADAVRGMWNSYPEKRRKKLSGKYNLTATNWWSAEPTVQVIVWMTHLLYFWRFLQRIHQVHSTIGITAALTASFSFAAHLYKSFAVYFTCSSHSNVIDFLFYWQLIKFLDSTSLLFRSRFLFKNIRLPKH